MLEVVADDGAAAAQGAVGQAVGARPGDLDIAAAVMPQAGGKDQRVGGRVIEVDVDVNAVEHGQRHIAHPRQHRIQVGSLQQIQR